MFRRPQRPKALRKCCCLALGLAWAACGQSPIPVFRVSTELIQVDAVVTDSKGVHVKGLTAADFEIEQDGRPQRVVSCSRVSAPTEDRTPAPAAPRATQEWPRRDGRRMVVLIDNTDLSAESLSATRAALLALIEKKVKTEDTVALVVASQGPGYFQGFTADKALLRGAVDRIPWRFTPGRSTGPLQPTVNEALDLKFPAMLAQQHLYDQLAVQYQSLGTLNSVLLNMGRLPGRKALTIVSDGHAFHWNSRLSADLANRAGVVVYHIDPRGMQATALNAMDRTDIFGAPLNPTQVAGLVDDRAEGLRMSELGTGEFPRQTGGYAVMHNNDISRVLANVFDDSGDYYLLTYKPDAGSLEDAGNSYHRLTVKVKNADLRVRSRRGFYAPAAAATGKAFDPIRLKVTPVLRRGEAGSPVFQSMIYIDTGDVQFKAGSDGRRHATIDCEIAFLDARGIAAARVEQAVTFRASAAQYSLLLHEGLVTLLPVSPPKTGTYLVVATVRDRSTGRIGSAAATVAVPNLSREEIALSSIRLSAGNTSPEDEFAETSSAARRRFRPGQPLNWECEVLAPAKGKSYQILVTLKRGKSIVYLSEPIKSSSPIRGRVHLGTDLEPGEYQFELQVDGATQAIDFETR